MLITANLKPGCAFEYAYEQSALCAYRALSGLLPLRNTK